jgi:hypothetical protein
VKVLEYGRFWRAVGSTPSFHGESLEYGPYYLLDPTEHVAPHHLKMDLVTLNRSIIKIQRLTCCAIRTLYSGIEIHIDIHTHTYEYIMIVYIVSSKRMHTQKMS